MVKTPAAKFHTEKWYAIAQCFLLNDDSTFDVFFTTDSLSHRITVSGWSSDIGIPNIHSLNINTLFQGYKLR